MKDKVVANRAGECMSDFEVMKTNCKLIIKSTNFPQIPMDVIVVYCTTQQLL